MAENRRQIEQIVHEVLAAMGAAPAGTPAAGGGATGASLRSAPATPGFAPATPGDNGDLVLNGRVVTLSDVEGRLKGVRRLVVPPQAVVTPAVRDELLAKNINLTFASAQPAASPGLPRLVMVAAGKRFDSGPLAAALRNDGIVVEPHTADCLIAATDRLAAEVAKPNTLGLLLTRYAAAGVCLANRHRGVRAVSSPGEVAEVGANLLVLDPTGLGILQLKQEIGEFCRGGVRPCPDVFRERLG